MSLTKIGSIGINTGIQLAGVTTVSTLHVGSGVTLSSDGDGFFTGITTFTRNFTGDYAVRISNTHATGQGLNIRGGSANGQYALLVEDYAAANLFEINGDGEVEVKANHLRANHGVVVTGIVTATSFAGSGANLTGIDTDLVSDTSPQLGGNLDVNTKNIVFGDSGGATDDRLTFGAGTDLSIYHNGSNSYIDDSGTGSLITRSNQFLVRNITNDHQMIGATGGGSVDLYHNNSKKFETASYGVLSAGQVRVSSSNATTVAFSAGDAGTGFYNSGSNAIGYAANGTQKWNINSSGDLNLKDNVKFTLGDSNDLLLYHDGTSNIVTSVNGNLVIQANSGETGINVIKNGAIELYHDNVKTFLTTAAGIQVQGPEGGAASINLYSDEGDDNADMWRIINNGSNFLKWQTYSSGSWQDAISAQGENQVRLFYNGSEKLNTSNHGISLTGKIYMNNGNLQFGASGNGIDFSATGDASGASSEVLDDYEEGTWTARFYPNSSSFSSSSYDLDAAKYTKIGNVVYWVFRIRISSFSGGGGNLEISGLPYTVASGQPMTTSSLHPSNWANNSPKNIVYKNGTTRMDLYYESGTANSAAATNPVPLSSLQNNSYLIGQGFYYV